MLRAGFLLTCLWLTRPVMAEWFTAQQAIMGTRISVEVELDDPQQAKACMDQVFTEMRRIDALMSPYKPDSELARLNREAARRPVPVSRELFDLIRRAQTISEWSDGAFDITFASAGFLYDYRRRRHPDAVRLQQAVAVIDYRQLQLDTATVSIGFARPGVKIDLGGIAKGHAVDKGIAILRHCGVQNGLVTAGGDSRILGDKGGRPWMMGVRHPRDPKGVAVVLPLSDTAISTSGDYERYFVVDGKRYHHILSPGTGQPVTGILSTTVIGPDATTTDALSTTVFVLGVERGLKLINNLPGFDALWIDAGGRVHYSEGLQPPSGGGRSD
jgi:thiamine biosynthesis lipoprotein